MGELRIRLNSYENNRIYRDKNNQSKLIARGNRGLDTHKLWWCLWGRDLMRSLGRAIRGGRSGALRDIRIYMKRVKAGQSCKRKKDTK